MQIERLDILRPNTGRYFDARLTIISARFENDRSTGMKLDRHWRSALKRTISILDVVAAEELYRNCILRNREKNG